MKRTRRASATSSGSDRPRVSRPVRLAIDADICWPCWAGAIPSGHAERPTAMHAGSEMDGRAEPSHDEAALVGTLRLRISRGRATGSLITHFRSGAGDVARETTSGSARAVAGSAQVHGSWLAVRLAAAEGARVEFLLPLPLRTDGSDRPRYIRSNLPGLVGLTGGRYGSPRWTTTRVDQGSDGEPASAPMEGNRAVRVLPCT